MVPDLDFGYTSIYLYIYIYGMQEETAYWSMYLASFEFDKSNMGFFYAARYIITICFALVFILIEKKKKGGGDSASSPSYIKRENSRS